MREQLFQRGTLLAIACFIPFDLLGYLAAVLLRNSPWWTLVLLVIPLVTLLLATRAITRGREDQRRLTVLLEAAVRVQSAHQNDQIGEALLYDARRLIRLNDVALSLSPPARGEVGAQVKRGKDPLWVVGPAQDRARSTIQADEQALGALAVLGSDAYARVQLTADMVHYARHDPLTDLPNRGILLDRVAHALHRAGRSRVRVALLFIDLDSFKPVNDRFGHAAGDAVLVEVARRLLECTRQSDTVARLGGDEFAVLLEDISYREAFEIADRILAGLSHGRVGPDPVSLGCSIGVAFGDGTESAEALLRKSDLAMYEAKGRGKAQAVAYEPTIGRERMEGLQLVDELRRAIETDALEVVYQPVVTARNDRIVGVEALVRWRQDGVEVPTEEFVRIAEATGLVVPLGELVLGRVANDALDLRAAAGGRISMSVNVSAGQLRDPGFVGVVERTLAAMAGTGLVLEITEREGIADDTGRAGDDADDRGARGAVRHRRLRGRVLLDRLPAPGPRARGEDRRDAGQRDRHRRAGVRGPGGHRHDGRGAVPRRRGRGHRASVPSSTRCATRCAHRWSRASCCTGPCRSPRCSRSCGPTAATRRPRRRDAATDRCRGAARPDRLTRLPGRRWAQCTTCGPSGISATVLYGRLVGTVLGGGEHRDAGLPPLVGLERGQPRQHGLQLGLGGAGADPAQSHPRLEDPSVHEQAQARRDLRHPSRHGVERVDVAFEVHPDRGVVLGLERW